jgi:hypothetical protein
MEITDDTEVLDGEMLPAIPERLSSDNISAVTDHTASHFMQLAANRPGSERFRSAARGSAGRLLACLVDAGELRPDFDAEAVIERLDAIEQSGNAEEVGHAA